LVWDYRLYGDEKELLLVSKHPSAPDFDLVCAKKEGGRLISLQVSDKGQACLS